MYNVVSYVVIKFNVSKRNFDEHILILNFLLCKSKFPWNCFHSSLLRTSPRQTTAGSGGWTDLAISSFLSFIFCHTLTTQSSTCCLEAFLIFTVWSAESPTDVWMKSDQYPFRICCKGLLMDTSSLEVQPPVRHSGLYHACPSSSWFYPFCVPWSCPVWGEHCDQVTPNLLPSSQHRCVQGTPSSAIQALVCSIMRTPSGAVSFRW